MKATKTRVPRPPRRKIPSIRAHTVPLGSAPRNAELTPRTTPASPPSTRTKLRTIRGARSQHSENLVHLARIQYNIIASILMIGLLDTPGFGLGLISTALTSRMLLGAGSRTPLSITESCSGATRRTVWSISSRRPNTYHRMRDRDWRFSIAGSHFRGRRMLPHR